ncbi:MAG: T9SS type A sorting domain-containing protein [Crocinitomicaceae bacterium]
MMKKLFSLFLCLPMFASYSQNLEWAAANENDHTGSVSAGRGTQVAVDPSGNVILTGAFYETVDFDPGIGQNLLTSAGDEDFFIQKLDADGNLLWVHHFGSTAKDVIQGLDVDVDGNIIVSGYFNNTFDFDPGVGTANLTSNGYRDMFILKLDSDGNYLWAHNFGAGGADYARNVKFDTLGNIYVSGDFQATVDFDPGPGTNNLVTSGGSDMFIQKLDSDGNLLWVHSFGSVDAEVAFGISMDTTGHVYYSGRFSNTIDFDPGTGVTNLTSVGALDVFVLKLDIDGNFIWAKSFGGTNDETSFDITNDEAGNVYCTGTFQGTVDFDPSGTGTVHTSAGGNDLFVLKLDTDGNFSWAHAFGGTNSETGTSIDAGPEGIFITGNYFGTIDFDPGSGTFNLSNTQSNANFFIQYLDFDGAFKWAGTTATVEASSGASIFYKHGYIHGTGYYLNDGNVDFDPGSGVFNLPTSYNSLIGASQNQIYVQKLCVPSSSALNISVCDSYTVPSGDETYTSSGVYMDTISNMSGCDSIMTITLTINNASTSAFPITACDSYTVPSGDETYIVSGVYKDTIPNMAGCDSVMTITLTVNNATTSAFSETVCNSYTVPSGDETYTTSGIYKDTIPNMSGCDSVMTISLTINSANTGVTQAGEVLTADAGSSVYQWIDCSDSSAVTGATSQDFTATSNGDYALIITENGCTDTSTCYQVSTVGIDEFESVNFAIYPNPTNGTFTIKLPNTTQSGEVKVLSLDGREISSKQFQSNSLIPMELNEANGTYIIQVILEDKIYKRLVVKH